MYFSSTLRFLLFCLCWTAAAAWSQEQARVIASTPTLSPSHTLNSNGEVIMLTMFNVVYDYAGKQYTVQLPYDPGPYLTLQITPTYSPPYYYSHPLPFTFNFGLGYYRWRR